MNAHLHQTISNLTIQLVEAEQQLTALRADLAALRNAADGMAGLIASQPHDITCRIIPSGHGVEPVPCDCWKSKAAAYLALQPEGRRQ